MYLVSTLRLIVIAPSGACIVPAKGGAGGGGIGIPRGFGIIGGGGGGGGTTVDDAVVGCDGGGGGGGGGGGDADILLLPVEEQLEIPLLEPVPKY